MSRCSPSTAPPHVSSSHSQPFARNHCSISRCPSAVAYSHVSLSQRQPFARAHCSVTRCPYCAALQHVIFVPRAVARARLLQHLEVPVLRCSRTHPLVPRPADLAKLLQFLELSAPRRCLTKAFSTRQITSPLQALHRAYTSDTHGSIFIDLLEMKPRRRHRIAHLTAHRWEPCEICWIVKVPRSENVGDDEVVGKARDGLARLSIALPLSFLRAIFHTVPRV